MSMGLAIGVDDGSTSLGWMGELATSRGLLIGDGGPLDGDGEERPESKLLSSTNG